MEVVGCGRWATGARAGGKPMPSHAAQRRECGAATRRQRFLYFGYLLLKKKKRQEE